MAASSNPDWRRIADLPDDAKREEMRRFFDSLHTRTDDERRDALREMIAMEYGLPREQTHGFTRARLDTWMAMDFDRAKPVADAYDAAMQTMPAEIAMRRIQTVQAVSMAMSPEDIERVRELVPTEVRQIPKVAAAVSGDGATNNEEGTAPARETPQEMPQKSARPWWAFWKKAS